MCRTRLTLQKKGIRLLFLSIFIIVLVSSVRFNSKANSDQAPYIYFYSREQSAFLVERADGSASRVLTVLSSQPDLNIIGPGWSPSGKWFAWAAVSLFQGLPGPVHDVSVIHSDGSSSFTLIELKAEQRMQHFDLSWSSKWDLLLVEYEIIVGQYENTSYTGFFVWDAESQEKLLERNWPLEDFLVDVMWTPDVTQPLLELHYGWNVPYDGFQLLNSQGDILLDRPIARSSYEIPGTRWATNGAVIYLLPDSRTLVYENALSNEQFSWSIPFGEDVRFIDWSPNGDYALIYTSAAWEEPPYQLWLLSVGEPKIELVSRQTKLLDIFGFQSYHEGDYALYAQSAWSPQNRWAFVITQEDRVYLLNPNGNTLKTITGLSNGQIGSIQWDPDGALVFEWRNPRSTDYRIYHYTPDDDRLELLTSAANPPVNWLEYFALSPDNKYLAYSEGDAYVLALQSDYVREMSLINTVYPDAADFSIREVIWHPEYNWLFLLGNGGGLFTRIVNVTTADGSTQRELGECFISASCFGWLPENVD